MKKFTLACLGLLIISNTLTAQRRLITGNTEKIINNLATRNIQALRTTATATCIDTVQYTLENSRTFGLFSQVGKGGGTRGEGLAQWFNVRQPITIKGFQFYGHAKNPGTTSVVTVSLYSAKADSTPNATLATTTITLNNINSNNLTAYLQTVNFSTPVSVTAPYLVAIEGPATSTDTFQLVINGDGDGFQETLSKVRINGTNWLDVLTEAYGLDVDLLAYPIVSYPVSAKYNVGGPLTPGSTVNFTNTSSPIFGDYFYNQAAYYFVLPLSFNWNLGEGGPAFGNAIDTSHVYATAANYTVVLKDTLYGWTVNCATDTTSIVRIGVALPVKLVTYEASKKDNKVSLTWMSENEFNSDYYVIERSADGVNFTPINRVNSNGILQSRQSYTFQDTSPIGGINYYRLVQFDKDGRATYYGIRVVSFKDNIASLQVYPNPATTSFIIRSQADPKIKSDVFISDAAGRVVKRFTLNASGVQTITTNDLLNGNYFIHLTTNGITSTKSLYINKK